MPIATAKPNDQAATTGGTSLAELSGASKALPVPALVEKLELPSEEAGTIILEISGLRRVGETQPGNAQIRVLPETTFKQLNDMIAARGEERTLVLLSPV